MNRDAYLAIACGLLGLALGYAIWGRQTEVIIEAPAPSVTWQDGSVTAARVVNEKPKLPAPSKPKGGKPIRTVEVTVQPVAKPDAPPCEPVNLRIDLDQYKDGIRASVIAENGSVVDAADYPVSPLIRPVERPWSAGVEKDGDNYRPVIQHDIGRLIVGATVGDGLRLRVLYRF
jgi:hypothetical protein